MTATITLTTAGADTGPFNLFSDVSTPPFTSAFDTNISKADLLSGFTTSNVPDGTTTIRIKSLGTCSNYIDVTVNAPSICKEFTFQAGAQANNTITYKDCITGVIMNHPLTNGNVLVQCAYSDASSYPRFTLGSGTVSPNGECSNVSRGCAEYTLFAFPEEGSAIFRYVPCNEYESIEVPVVEGNVSIVCTNPVFVPQLVSGAGSATNTEMGCSPTTTTSTTTSPP